MGWPQMVLLVVFAIRIGAAAAYEAMGKPPPRLGLIDRIVDALVTGAILWWGGFFSG